VVRKGHLGKSQNKDPSMLENAIAEDATPDPGDPTEADVETEAAADKPSDVKTLSSDPEQLRPVVKQAEEGHTTMRIATGVFNSFRTGSASPQQPTLSSTAVPPRRARGRKTSMSILARSVSSSVLSPPILGAFTIPPPLPGPACRWWSVPVSARVPADSHNDDEGKGSLASASASVMDGEVASVLSLGQFPKDKEPEEPGCMQGSSLRALSNATRVMTSDPASIPRRPWPGRRGTGDPPRVGAHPRCQGWRP